MANFTIDVRTESQINADAKFELAAALGVESLPPLSNLDLQTTVYSRHTAKVYDSIATTFNSSYLSTTTAPWLDTIAGDFGLTRTINAITIVPKESETFKLRTKDGTSLLSALGVVGRNYDIIPKGLVVTSTDNNFRKVVFKVMESTIVASDAAAVCLTCAADLDDAINIPIYTFNTLSFSQLTNFPNKNTANLELVQVKPVIGVQKVESDESLRARVSSYLTAKVSTNVQNVLSLVAERPDVAFARIVPATRGTGSADVILYPTRYRVSESSIAYIQNKLDQQKNAGSSILVRQPRYITTSMKIKTATDPNTVVVVLENLISSISTRSISHTDVVTILQKNNISASVERLTINGRDLLPQSRVELFDTELFELRARIPSEAVIEVTR